MQLGWRDRKSFYQFECILNQVGVSQQMVDIGMMEHVVSDYVMRKGTYNLDLVMIG